MQLHIGVNDAPATVAPKVEESHTKMTVKIDDLNAALKEVFESGRCTWVQTLSIAFSVCASLYALVCFDDLGSSWTIAWFYINLINAALFCAVIPVGLAYPNTRIWLALSMLPIISVQCMLILTGPMVLRLGAGDAHLLLCLVWLNKLLSFVKVSCGDRKKRE